MGADVPRADVGAADDHVDAVDGESRGLGDAEQLMPVLATTGQGIGPAPGGTYPDSSSIAANWDFSAGRSRLTTSQITSRSRAR